MKKAGNRILLCTWLEKSASPLHILHCGYGIGGFIAPLIANPFLAEFKTIGNLDLNVTSSDNLSASTLLGYDVTTDVLNLSTEIVVVETSRIEICYAIVGAMTIAMSVVFCFLQCYSNDDQKRTTTLEKGDTVIVENKLTKERTFRQLINPATCANGNLCFGMLILGLMFTRYFFFTACDRLLGTFIRSYSVDFLGYSKDEGSYINTIYWVAYSAGRIVCFVAANFISIKVLFLLESLGAVATTVLMIFFTIPLQYKQSFWYLTGLIGFFIGPIFPSGLAWADLHIEMTGLAITWVMFGSAFGGLAFYNIGGHAYDTHGPSSFIYIVCGLSVTLCAVDIILTFISVCKGRKDNSDYELGDIKKTDVFSRRF